MKGKIYTTRTSICMTHCTLLCSGLSWPLGLLANDDWRSISILITDISHPEPSSQRNADDASPRPPCRSCSIIRVRWSASRASWDVGSFSRSVKSHAGPLWRDSTSRVDLDTSRRGYLPRTDLLRPFLYPRPGGEARVHCRDVGGNHGEEQ